MEKRIEDYQLRELYKETLYINRYSLDLMYDYELNRYWKEFFFDLTQCLGKVYTFNYLKKNYKQLIEDNDLAIDFRDYVELNDYIAVKEWLAESDSNTICQDDDGIYLIGA